MAEGNAKGIAAVIEFIPKDVADQLAQARRAADTKKTRFRVAVGDEMIPLARLTRTSFAIDRDLAPRLRGLVDIYDGAEHLYQALVVASSFDGDAVVFEFKRNTVPSAGPALDFVRDQVAPVALLP